MGRRRGLPGQSSSSSRVATASYRQLLEARFDALDELVRELTQKERGR
jgi:hypothetical protein